MDADLLPKDARRPAPQVHVVTAEEAAAKHFGIERVVLPLPGQEAVYPEHATAQARHHLMALAGPVPRQVITLHKVPSVEQ